MTNPLDFYLTDVYPQLPALMREQMQARYPDIRLRAETGFAPLADYPVCMVVGLTGTGKSTTLSRLAARRESGQVAYRDDIPTRREVADWIVIPVVQVLNGEPVAPLKGREARFAATRRFAQEVPGGLAAAFSWLYYRGDSSIPLVSEGVRGPDEIRYVLEHFPRWRVFELWVPPLVRLQRLSGRADSFDQLANPNAAVDVSFLPRDVQAEALRLWQRGVISQAALVTLHAEAQNYGHQPFDHTNTTARYRFLNIEQVPPEDAATELVRFIHEIG